MDIRAAGTDIPADTLILAVVATPVDNPIRADVATPAVEPTLAGVAILVEEATTVEAVTTADVATTAVAVTTAVAATTAVDLVSASAITAHRTTDTGMLPATTSRTIAILTATTINGAIGTHRPLAATRSHTDHTGGIDAIGA